MQDNWQEFDRQIQSVLQDAGEKVPRRVWRAVSGRLDSAASAALWWRWAVPAFVAAAIVAGLFLSGTFGTTGSKSGNVDILADAGIVSSEVVPSDDITVVDSEEPLVIPSPHKVRKLTARQVAGTEPDVLPEPAEDVSEAPAVVPYEPAETKQKDVAADTYDAEAAAQWTRIENEENRHRIEGIKLRNLYAQGSVGGNDSNLSYGGSGISHMAPGAGSDDAGISEVSQSTYGVPFTVGIGARFGITDKLSIGTGIDYSLLTRTFKGNYTGSAASKFDGHIVHNVHYLGVPLNVYYDLLQTRDELMKVYAWGGAEAEYCIANSFTLLTMPNAVIPDKAGGFQFSAALGLGLEFKLNDFLGLYADPSVRYYFHGNQPKSLRTDKPLMFSFDAGLRFNF